MEAKHYADDLCRHITDVTRIYNDCGSIARNSAKKNLNSVDFPEFATTASGSDKRALQALGEYERACCQVSFAHLKAALVQTAATPAEEAGKRRRLDVWQVFLNTAELCGQIYVICDFTARSVHVRDVNIDSTVDWLVDKLDQWGYSGKKAINITPACNWLMFDMIGKLFE